jgi:hypothetical protein
MDDATRPELEFLRRRELELRQELEKNAAALGIPAITERTSVIYCKACSRRCATQGMRC